MKRPTPFVSACALSACLAVSSAHVHAHDHAHSPAHMAKIDARILSSAPFEFRADSAIFSPIADEPSDARIFMLPKPAPLSGETGISAARFQPKTSA